jgi:Yip1 domain
MTQPPSASSGGAAPLSLVQRFLGMLTSPKATYENVVSWPRWGGMLVLTTLITVITVFVFLSTEVGRDIVMKQQIEAGAPASQAEMAVKFSRFIAPVAMVIFIPLFALAVSGILLGVFAVTGGTASFKQVLSVYVHSGVVGTVAGVVNGVINYFLATDTNVTSLKGIGNAFAEKGFMAGFFGALDLTFFLGLFVLAIGLAVLYRRRTAPIFFSLSAVYLVVALVIGGVKAAMAGGS